MNEVTAYLGLGSNLGSRWVSLRLALAMLEEPREEIRVLRTSQVYETPPWGFTDQPDFLNCVAEITTALDPYLLLQRHQIFLLQLPKACQPTRQSPLPDMGLVSDYLEVP